MIPLLPLQNRLVAERSDSLPGAICGRILRDLGATVTVPPQSLGQNRSSQSTPFEQAVWTFARAGTIPDRPLSDRWPDLVIADRPLEAATPGIWIDFDPGTVFDALSTHAAGAMAALAALVSLYRPSGPVRTWAAGAASLLTAGHHRDAEPPLSEPTKSEDSILPERLEMPRGCDHPEGLGLPEGPYPARDGQVWIAVPTPAQLADVAAMLDGAGIAAAPRLADRMAAWLAARTRAEAMTAALAWRLPWGLVCNLRELPSDPQVIASGGMRRLTVTGFGQGLGPRFPVKLLAGVQPSVGSKPPEEPAETRLTIDRPQEPLRSEKDRGGPLSGIRVLDLTAMWSGPLATRLLADLGADVLKIESPLRLDGSRAGLVQGMPSFAQLNRGKRSLLLDLRQPSEHDRLLALLSRADLLISNQSPRVLRNLDLSEQDLTARFPGLITVLMPAFGSTGPYSNGVAYGRAIQAMTGIMDLSGSDPLPMLPLADPITGLYGAIGALAGLLLRHQTGHGCVLDVAHRNAFLYSIGGAVVADSLAIPLQSPTASHFPTGRALIGGPNHREERPPLWDWRAKPLPTLANAPFPDEGGMAAEQEWLSHH